MTAEILDPCCGGRMWWWDKAHPLAVYMDKREAVRGSVGTRWFIFYKPVAERPAGGSGEGGDR